MTTDQTLPPLRRSLAVEPTVPPRPTHPVAADAKTADPRWTRPALIGLLVATAVLYIWGLGASGWANDFYSAAAQAGSASWKALFFGSSDAANAITVDKPPLSLWAMALSVRVFGLSGWSILVPQALMGVASVGVLFATVRRWFGPAAGLLAGAVLALTPVAVLMFRFNNPDALLVLLLTIGADMCVRALERGSGLWLAGAGAMVGLGFLTKMLQALLVVPAFALVYLIAAPVALSARVRHVLLAGAAMVAAAGWWVATVELVPASMRPYMGGSQSNSVLELIFGYNGFGRLTGNETGSVGGGGPGGTQGGNMWGVPSWHRMFDATWAGQIAWFIPAALLALCVILFARRRADRTDRTRAAAILWGGWLVVTMAVFSYGKGIIHEYYAVALAPAIAALVAVGATVLWRRRATMPVRIVLAAAVLGTTIFAAAVLGHAATWHPELRRLALGLGVAAAALIVAGDGWHRRARAIAATVALVAVLLAPAAYAVQTASTPHGGAIPAAGPAVSAARGGPGAVGGPGGFGGMPPGGVVQGGPVMVTPTAGGGPGGLLSGSRPSAQVLAALTDNADSYTWVAAAVGSNSAAGYQLATQLPVMAVGGFNGSDPSPTLSQFQALVRAGKIHWFIGGGGGPGGGFGTQMGGSQSSSDIAQWVAQNFTAQTIGTTTMYDLTAGANGASA